MFRSFEVVGASALGRKTYRVGEMQNNGAVVWTPMLGPTREGLQPIVDRINQKLYGV